VTEAALAIAPANRRYQPLGSRSAARASTSTDGTIAACDEPLANLLHLDDNANIGAPLRRDDRDLVRR
jgi:hypothetical protein